MPTDAPLVPQEPCPECGGDGGWVETYYRAGGHEELVPRICTACAGTGSIDCEPAEEEEHERP